MKVEELSISWQSQIYLKHRLNLKENQLKTTESTRILRILQINQERQQNINDIAKNE